MPSESNLGEANRESCEQASAEESLLTKNSPSKLGGVPQGRGSVRNFIEYSQQSTEYR